MRPTRVCGQPFDNADHSLPLGTADVAYCSRHSDHGGRHVEALSIGAFPTAIPSSSTQGPFYIVGASAVV